jgi:hypothetical protein
VSTRVVGPREFDVKRTDCYLCRRDRECTFLKAAHVTVYAWVCLDCTGLWIDE